jgi:hypothetical protein
VGEVDALHRKRLKVNFDTDEAQQEYEIEAKTREITEVFHHAEGLLKKFGKQSEDPNLSTGEKTVRKNMQMAMAKKLQSLSLSFRSQQKVSEDTFCIVDVLLLCSSSIEVHGEFKRAKDGIWISELRLFNGGKQKTFWCRLC